MRDGLSVNSNLFDLTGLFLYDMSAKKFLFIEIFINLPDLKQSE